MGRLIPAGTGFELYRHVLIPADEPRPPALPQPSDDELELERDIKYLILTEGTDFGERSTLIRRLPFARIDR